MTTVFPWQQREVVSLIAMTKLFPKGRMTNISALKPYPLARCHVVNVVVRPFESVVR